MKKSIRIFMFLASIISVASMAGCDNNNDKEIHKYDGTTMGNKTQIDETAENTSDVTHAKFDEPNIKDPQN